MCSSYLHKFWLKKIYVLHHIKSHCPLLDIGLSLERRFWLGLELIARLKFVLSFPFPCSDIFILNLILLTTPSGWIEVVPNYKDKKKLYKYETLNYKNVNRCLWSFISNCQYFNTSNGQIQKMHRYTRYQGFRRFTHIGHGNIWKWNMYPHTPTPHNSLTTYFGRFSSVSIIRNTWYRLL